MGGQWLPCCIGCVGVIWRLKRHFGNAAQDQTKTVKRGKPTEAWHIIYKAENESLKSFICMQTIPSRTKRFQLYQNVHGQDILLISVSNLIMFSISGPHGRLFQSNESVMTQLRSCCSTMQAKRQYFMPVLCITYPFLSYLTPTETMLLFCSDLTTPLLTTPRTVPANYSKQKKPVGTWAGLL